MNSQSHKTVLIIDDEDYMRDIVQTCLEVFGECMTITAESGVKGLEIAAQLQPDVIILDVMMPDMHGLAFLEKLQANPLIANIPVVLLTACSNLTEPQAIAKFKVKGTIPKPFQPETIFSQLSQILNWE